MCFACILCVKVTLRQSNGFYIFVTVHLHLVQMSRGENTSIPLMMVKLCTHMLQGGNQLMSSKYTTFQDLMKPSLCCRTASVLCYMFWKHCHHYGCFFILFPPSLNFVPFITAVILIDVQSAEIILTAL